MPIPVSEREIYEKNPIIEVVCQLNFPPILRIDTELPAKYQEKIRSTFPSYEDSFEETIPQPTIKRLKSYLFVSDDRSRQIILTREFIAFVTTNYITWDKFLEWFENPLKEFINEYDPPYFSRVGLRYKDLIVRSELNLANEDWSTLLKPEIACELSGWELSKEINHKSTQVVFALEDNSKVILHHGLVNNQNNEQCYLIDSDFSANERTEVSNVASKLKEFNRNSGNLFRRCATEKLRDALGVSGNSINNA